MIVNLQKKKHQSKYSYIFHILEPRYEIDLIFLKFCDVEFLTDNILIDSKELQQHCRYFQW